MDDNYLLGCLWMFRAILLRAFGIRVCVDFMQDDIDADLYVNLHVCTCMIQPEERERERARERERCVYVHPHQCMSTHKRVEMLTAELQNNVHV